MSSYTYQLNYFSNLKLLKTRYTTETAKELDKSYIKEKLHCSPALQTLSEQPAQNIQYPGFNSSYKQLTYLEVLFPLTY